jgi:hypothetical protein
MNLKFKKTKDFFQDFSRIFQEYSRNIFPKVVKKQVSVAHVIPFAPPCQEWKIVCNIQEGCNFQASLACCCWRKE